MGVPPSALAATVERFNGFAAGGVDDDFGRGSDEYDRFFAAGGDGPNPALVALDQPPFHAARLVLSDLGTKGGLVTDPAGRVLRDDGSVLPGLFAAGNSAASMFGSVYPGPGAPLGSGMVTASLAVRAMLDEPGESQAF
jgi:3-oxosteroid 1-dehydrogenase